MSEGERLRIARRDDHKTVRGEAWRSSWKLNMSLARTCARVCVWMMMIWVWLDINRVATKERLCVCVEIC